MNSKNNKKKQILRGYVRNDSFGPYCLPVSFQNKLLKQYCKEKNMQFALPQGELVFAKNFIQLKSLINKIKNNEGLLMISLFMLPSNFETRKEIIKNFIKKKIECHFLIENKVAKTKNDYNEIENIMKVSSFQKDSIKIFNSIKKS